jgi:hypothetical protein
MDDLSQCMRTDQSVEAMTESCFRVSEKYWTLLRKELTGYSFSSREEEILFFKTIKPRFTSEIEYYGLVYHALMFVPDEITPADMQNFWKRQLTRLDRLMNDHEGFFNYCRSGRTHKDKQYFTRKEDDEVSFSEPRYYYQDQQSASSHDHLLASRLALERYTQYVKEQLLLIPGNV